MDRKIDCGDKRSRYFQIATHFLQKGESGQGTNSNTGLTTQGGGSEKTGRIVDRTPGLAG